MNVHLTDDRYIDLLVLVGVRGSGRVVLATSLVDRYPEQFQLVRGISTQDDLRSLEQKLFSQVDIVTFHKMIRSSEVHLKGTNEYSALMKASTSWARFNKKIDDLDHFGILVSSVQKVKKGKIGVVAVPPEGLIPLFNFCNVRLTLVGVYPSEEKKGTLEHVEEHLDAILRLDNINFDEEKNEERGEITLDEFSKLLQRVGLLKRDTAVNI